MFIEKDGLFVCSECSYELSAMPWYDEIPERCDCKGNKMDKQVVYRVIDGLRCGIPVSDLLIKDRLMNYLEANIDEFIECYEESEE